MNVKKIKELKRQHSNRIDYFLKNLPEDIIRMIYYEHFVIELKFQRIMKVFTSTKCHRLYYCKILVRQVDEIMRNQQLLDYMLGNCNSFAKIYDTYDKSYLKNVLLKNGCCVCGNKDNNCAEYTMSEFARSWLFYEYH